MSEIKSSQNSGISAFAFDAKETAVMSIATAIGGVQLMAINRGFGLPMTQAASLDSPATRIVGAMGGIALGIGLAGLFGALPIGRTASAGLFGYGTSSIISIGLPIIASMLSSSGTGSSPSPRPSA